jgi:hypothetical protein
VFEEVQVGHALKAGIAVEWVIDIGQQRRHIWDPELHILVARLHFQQMDQARQAAASVHAVK